MLEKELYFILNYKIVIANAIIMERVYDNSLNK